MEDTEKRKIIGRFNIDDYWAESLEPSLSRQFAGDWGLSIVLFLWCNVEEQLLQVGV